LAHHQEIVKFFFNLHRSIK